MYQRCRLISGQQEESRGWHRRILNTHHADGWTPLGAAMTAKLPRRAAKSRVQGVARCFEIDLRSIIRIPNMFLFAIMQFALSDPARARLCNMLRLDFARCFLLPDLLHEYPLFKRTTSQCWLSRAQCCSAAPLRHPGRVSSCLVNFSMQSYSHLGGPSKAIPSI